jgi:hypothetical protein
MEKYGRVQEGTGRPKIYISKDLQDLDKEGNPFNFLMAEAENLKWEEMKTDLGIEQKPIWNNKQAKHAIDALSYIIATIEQPEPEYVPRTQTAGIDPFYPGLGI